MTSYQKLKAENLKLKQDLITLSTYPDSVKAIIIKAEWVMISKTEEALWMGNNEMPQVFKGFLDQISNG